MYRSCWREGRRPSATEEAEGSDGSAGGRPTPDCGRERVSIQPRRTHTMQFSEDALKFLNLGINSEIAAYVFYKHAGAIVKEKGLQDTLHKLANDEKGHFLTLEDLYDRNVRSEMWAPYKDILGKEGLPDIDELVQDTHKELLARIRGVATKREVLEMALMLEKEAFTLFSEASAKMKSPELKKVFDFLAGFERNHVVLIEKELAAL